MGIFSSIGNILGDAGEFVGNILTGGSFSKADAAKDSARHQTQATEAAIAAQERALAQARGDLAPYRNAGNAILGPLGNMAQGGQSFLNHLPSLTYDLGHDSLFNFLKTQTMNDIQNSAAARGKLGSGGTLLGLGDAIQNLALSRSGDILQQKAGIRNQYVNERNQLYNQQLALAQMGGNAAAGSGNASMQSGQILGGYFGDIGNARAAGDIGKANALGTAYETGGKIAQNLFKVFMPGSTLMG